MHRDNAEIGRASAALLLDRLQGLDEPGYGVTFDAPLRHSDVTELSGHVQVQVSPIGFYSPRLDAWIDFNGPPGHVPPDQ